MQPVDVSSHIGHCFFLFQTLPPGRSAALLRRAEIQSGGPWAARSTTALKNCDRMLRSEPTKAKTPTGLKIRWRHHSAGVPVVAVREVLDPFAAAVNDPAPDAVDGGLLR